MYFSTKVTLTLATPNSWTTFVNKLFSRPFKNCPIRSNWMQVQREVRHRYRHAESGF